MQLPSHGLFGRQTKRVQGCTTQRESTAAPDHLQFRSSKQEAEHTGRFRGLRRRVVLRYRYLWFEAIGKNNGRCGTGTKPKGRSPPQFRWGDAGASRMAQRPGHPAARHSRGSPGKEPEGGRCRPRGWQRRFAVAAAGQGRAARRWRGRGRRGAGAERAGRAGRRCPGSWKRGRGAVWGQGPYPYSYPYPHRSASALRWGLAGHGGGWGARCGWGSGAAARARRLVAG